MKQLTEFETQTLAHMMAIEYVLAYLGKVAFLDAGLGMEEVAFDPRRRYEELRPRDVSRH